jgi:RNA recognition motif-containing protein
VTNIYVGNLPFSATEADLQQLFGEHGQVQRASIVMDRDTGRPRGFGFVEMANDAEGQAAIAALNGKDFGGRALVVNVARPRENSRGGGGGGGFGGGGGGRGRGGGGGGYGGGGGRGGW